MSEPSTQTGRIIAAHGRHYTVELGDGTLRTVFPRGKKTGPAVGDRVQVTFERAGEGVIDAVHERRNLLYRSDDMRTKQFAANVDQLLIVIATEPAYSDDLLGRALVAAGSADIAPVIVLNKSDLPAGTDRVLARLAPLAASGVPVIETSALDPQSTRDALLPVLENKCSLLLGQSGMGKSTLLNALVPQANAATQEHSQALGAGKHTTTTTRLYHLPTIAGDLIDSPGFQAFGLQHLGPSDIERGFPEFSQGIQHCRFYNCTHRHEPGCGVLAALGKGDITPERHELYKRILAENESKSRY
ncbi:MAG: ribosome small subunit-dependent GTPase A [Burkholderiaceae bacterium]|jgi:ribosome biogenesis GTPase